VLSHLHHDHADGLPDLVGAPVFVSAAHWAAFGRPLQAALQGAVPAQWPVGFVPHILEPIGPPVGPWNKSYPITEDGRVVAVDTPGHVPGHISLLVRSDDATYLAAGDLTYDQDLLDAEITDGVNDDPHEAVESLRKVKEYARQVPLVVLPAHDPHAAHRLENAEVFVPS